MNDTKRYVASFSINPESQYFTHFSSPLQSLHIVLTDQSKYGFIADLGFFLFGFNSKEGGSYQRPSTPISPPSTPCGNNYGNISSNHHISISSEEEISPLHMDNNQNMPWIDQDAVSVPGVQHALPENPQTFFPI